MRLSAKELSAITNAFYVILENTSFRLYLFGSRTDDKKKGGDIDLLVIVEKEMKNSVVEKKVKIRSAIFDRIPEQKIDITVAAEEELITDTFLRSIFSECILLIEK